MSHVVTPATDGATLFARSAQEVVSYLTRTTRLPSWSVSRLADTQQVHLHADGSGLLLPGMQVAWQDTFCRRMVGGAANVVRDSTLDPNYSDLPDVPAIRAYAGTPLAAPDGELFGVLCGVSDQPLSDEQSLDADLLRLFGDLLAAQLVTSRRLDLAVSDARIAQGSAETDALTGLLNRRGWDLAMAEAQARVDSYGDRVGVAVLDLDGLKTINDEDGHAAGDALLRRAAQVLSGSVRSTDRLARYGGDEFTLILNEATDAQREKRVNELVAALAAAGIAASAGSSAARPSDFGLVEAFGAADAAMYRSKRSRRSARDAASADGPEQAAGSLSP
ncbi:diguanylate cyclase domain-containing protein [Nocardioides sp. Bht2]|uniref:GGDEF domain-containing protein n=1 Tax=Nocardioides sp. Bht2 TaxID=3392297 RepID=UPI0039B3D099